MQRFLKIQVKKKVGCKIKTIVFVSENLKPIMFQEIWIVNTIIFSVYFHANNKNLKAGNLSNFRI